LDKPVSKQPIKKKKTTKYITPTTRPKRKRKATEKYIAEPAKQGQAVVKDKHSDVCQVCGKRGVNDWRCRYCLDEDNGDEELEDDNNESSDEYEAESDAENEEIDELELDLGEEKEEGECKCDCMNLIMRICTNKHIINKPPSKKQKEAILRLLF
jgi:hypothetical protein